LGGVRGHGGHLDSILTAVAVFDAWKYFFWLYLIPVVAANMQSLRKYVEHIGLTGRR
jgi:hypothetical protein